MFLGHHSCEGEPGRGNNEIQFYRSLTKPTRIRANFSQKIPKRSFETSAKN